MITKRVKFILNNEEIRNGNIFSIIETSNQEILALDYGSGIFNYNAAADEFHLYINLENHHADNGLLVIHRGRI